LLEVDELHVRYGAIRAVQGVSFRVEPGSITTIIGANGAGKSTIVRAITGLLRPASGSIRLDGIDLTRLPAYRIARLGVSLVPEGRRVLPEMTVLENLQMGIYGREGLEGRKSIQDMFDRFPVLAERRHQLAGLLSGGEQQMLAIARALVSRPRLLLMDEPSLGLAPKVVSYIFAVIEQIRREGTTVLLVEQNARKALAVADWAYVLETGRLVLSGPARELSQDPSVRAAYLGGATK